MTVCMAVIHFTKMWLRFPFTLWDLGEAAFTIHRMNDTNRVMKLFNV